MLVTTSIHQGKLSGHASQLIRRELENLEGKQVEIFITEPKKNRTTRQNKLLWSIYKPMAEYTGYTEEELHELLKAEFIGVETFQVGENIFLKPKTSTRLTTKGFTKFLDKVMFVAEWLGISNQLIGE